MIKLYIRCKNSIQAAELTYKLNSALAAANTKRHPVHGVVINAPEGDEVCVELGEIQTPSDISVYTTRKGVVSK